MICKNCGNEQESGKFCGKCGAPLHTEQIDQQQTYEHEQQQSKNVSPQNETLDKVKHRSKQYWGYYLHYLKHPTSVFQHTDETKNGLISIGIFVVIMTLLISSLMNSLTSEIGVSYNDTLTISSNSILASLVTFLIFIFVPISLLFIINLGLGVPYNYKQMIAIYGGFLSLPILLCVLAIVFLIIHSYLFFSFILLVSYIIVVALIPFYLITALLHNNSKKLDSFYGYLIFYVAYILVNILLFTIFADSMLGDIFNTLEDFFRYL